MTTMVGSTAWIKQNMLNSPQPNPLRGTNNTRPLSEAEIRVKRSLEKLSIPEWYLNNSSKPPKILSHNTPIDTRQPPWKTGISKKNNKSNTSIMSIKEAKENIDIVPIEKHNTSVDSSRNNEVHVEIKSNHNKTMATTVNCEKEISKASTHNNAPKITRRSLNISQSFPKISPSRKIENINIIFPPSSKFNCDTINLSNESLNDLEGSCVDDDDDDDDDSPENSKADNTDFYTPNSKTLVNSPNDYTTTMMKPYKLQSPSAFYKSPLSTLTTNTLMSTCSPTPQNSPMWTSEEKKFSRILRPATPTPPPQSHNSEEVCDDCKANLVSSANDFINKYSNENYNAKPRRILMSIDENTVMHSNRNKTFEELTNELEKLPNDTIISEKGLVHEIIEEFQQKCKNSTNSNYSTPGSRNFVRKLVKVLERSFNGDYEKLEEYDDDDDDNYIIDDETEKQQQSLVNEYSTVGPSSPTLSLSISSKGSSSEASTAPDYNWSKQVHGDLKTLKDRSIPEDKYNHQDDPVIWIPVDDSIDMPWTSSLRSDVSSWSKGKKSPCLSPISKPDERKMIFHRENLDKLPRRRLYTDENGGIIDSGYAEKSPQSAAVIFNYTTSWDQSSTILSEINGNSFISHSIKV